MENNSDYYGEKQLDASESKGRNDDYARDYTITFELGVELENKYKNLEDRASELKGQELVNLRIRQLSIVKILVKIHGRDPQLLVKAHSYLGHAYAESRCSEQAYEHLITAKKRNEAYEETEQGREYQLYILKLLITNCLQNDRIEEATDYIQEAETICQTVQEEQGGVTMDYAHIKKSMGEAYTLKKKYKDAIECYLEASRIIKETGGEQTPEYAQTYRAIYKIYMKDSVYEEAIKYLDLTITKYEEIESVENLNEILIALYSEKIEILPYQKFEVEEDKFEHLKICYVRMKELSIQEYGESDARTLKALKKLMIFLSKREEFQEALENLDQIEKIELANYGLKSNQIAKTYSMKATLLHKIGEKKKAKAIYKYI